MAIAGLYDTDSPVTDERPKNWREGILQLEPNGDAPLTALTSRLKSGSRVVDDPEFYWWTLKTPAQRYGLGSDLTSSNTTITLTGGGDELRPGHLLRVEETGEHIIVSSVTNATTVVVVRGAAGTSGTAVDYDGAGINPNLLVVGNANEEGSAKPTAIRRAPSKYYNYCQIFRNNLAITETARRTRLRTSSDIVEARRQALQYHMLEMERAFFLGKRHEDTANGHPRRFTEGFFSFVEGYNSGSNEDDFTSAVDMETFEESLYKAFEWGSTEKVAWCGNRALLTVQQIIRKNSNIELTPAVREYGMNVNRLVTPFGTLVLRMHRLFNLVPDGSDYNGLASSMAIMDMNNLRYCHLRGRDTKYEANQQGRGDDAFESGYITEAGLELHHPESHYVIHGLNEAAVDA